MCSFSFGERQKKTNNNAGVCECVRGERANGATHRSPFVFPIGFRSTQRFLNASNEPTHSALAAESGARGKQNRRAFGSSIRLPLNYRLTSHNNNKKLR